MFARVDDNATGNGGDVMIETRRLLVQDGAFISSASRGDGIAGDINITVRDTLEANNGTIATSITRSAGGSVKITAGDIRLFGDSDIISNVASGAGNGGNIYLEADSILGQFWTQRGHEAIVVVSCPGGKVSSWELTLRRSHILHLES